MADQRLILLDQTLGRPYYCFGKKFVKVLMHDSPLLHGVIAYARTHYNQPLQDNLIGNLLCETSESSHTEFCIRMA